MYKHFVRPILFLLKPETVHGLVVKSLKTLLFIPGIKILIKGLYSIEDSSLEREVFGLKFRNPIGLAAGFDKNADYFNELSAFGFSFIEIGSVTPKPQPGNPKPRSFRLTKDKAIINRMGFNNKGVAHAKKRLERYSRANVVLGGNIGKNTLTPNENAHEDYLYCFKQLYSSVDYFAVNVSCPNVTNLKDLQNTDSLRRILDVLVTYRYSQKKYKPILLKVSPDLTNDQLQSNVNLAIDMGLDGFIATNTTTSRLGLKTDEQIIENIGNGGLSGKPLKYRSIEVIRLIAQQTNGRLPIIGVGGIMTPADAIEMIKAGATLIQIYTGFIYSGPALAKNICKHLLKL
ncbi:MAG: quinone-dependent dihydroorotate dehydrogenase [Bacteroidales bacterium]